MKKWIVRIITAIFAVCILTGMFYTGKGYVMFKDALKECSLTDKVQSIRSRENYTPLEQLPKMYIDAVVAVEDHRFYDHGPIDIISIGRAVWVNLTSLSLAEGGSSITQQLAKNIYFTQEKKLERKIAETFMAFVLEKQYSKDDILELYVNTIYFGSGYYGVYDASQGYFGKIPSGMNDYECTLLAGIPNAPSVYSPDVNPELAAQRHQQVLDRMVGCHLITEEEAQAIMAMANIDKAPEGDK
ncbi:MAG TPA: transglycosylase domain-containing protein [Clostridiaceae bacterium]|nr:transglycosylase domain-containing protein [Clostridiaceae bacterium]